MIQKNNEIYKAIKSAQNPLNAERDYMECRVLDTMFADSDLHNAFVFSGGATLTKSYNICQRISHDLDLVCTDFTELPADRTKRQLLVFKRRFKEFVFDELRTKINYAVNQDKRFMIATDREWVALHNMEQQVSYPTLHLLYTSALNSSFEHICIEITPRIYDESAISYHTVTPYSIYTPMREIPTVKYEQTFWDKIFALNSMASAGIPRNRFFISRHYFDVAKMADLVNLGETYHLFNDTIKYQNKYTTKEIAPIFSAADIQLLPTAEVLAALENEYRKHSNQFLCPQPQWGDIIKKLAILKSRLNNLGEER